MKTLLLSLTISAGALFAGDCISKPCSTAINFSFDLIGTPDDRPDTWGTAGVQTKQLVFHPPEGYRVRIIRVYGDFVVWPRGNAGSDRGDMVFGKLAGTLLGLSSTAPDRSEYVEGGGASDGCFLYVQVAAKKDPERVAIDHNTAMGGLLEKDGTVNVKAAVWLNTLGLAIHMEPSLVLVYQFEREAVEVKADVANNSR